MTVDAYAHCGEDKYLPVAALDGVMSASGVSAAVLAQHLGQFDNSYIAALVRDRPERFAGIALIDHRAPGWSDALALVAQQGFRGVRITSAALVEEPALVPAIAAAGLVALIYAPEGIAALVPRLTELAGSHPHTPLVVSHLGNPRVEDERLVAGTEMLSLAASPNIHVALSGLGMFCPFPHTPLDGLIGDVVAAFGAGRVMWGSNYPVCGEDPSDYDRELGLLLRPGRWGVSRAAAQAIAETNARRLWFG
jgi:L-fuconolactonase